MTSLGEDISYFLDYDFYMLVSADHNISEISNENTETLFYFCYHCVFKSKYNYSIFCFYFQPERIDPPDPTRPDYDIRADVWSLGISLVST